MPPRLAVRPLRSFVPHAQARSIPKLSSQSGPPPREADDPIAEAQSMTPPESLDRIFSASTSMASSLATAQSTAISQRQADMASSLAKIAELGRAADLEKQRYRRWRGGDVYAPHDLTSTEMVKWRQKRKPNQDAFDVLGMNPLDEYKNFAIMSEFMTGMGRIKHSSETGLRPVNQRRVAKAIRRAIGIGIMPSIHQHPQLIEHEAGMNGRWTRPI